MMKGGNERHLSSQPGVSVTRSGRTSKTPIAPGGPNKRDIPDYIIPWPVLMFLSSPPLSSFCWSRFFLAFFRNSPTSVTVQLKAASL